MTLPPVGGVTRRRERRRIVTARPFAPSLRDDAILAVRLLDPPRLGRLVHRWHGIVDRRQHDPLHLTRGIDARLCRQRQPMIDDGMNGLVSSMFVASAERCMDLMRPSFLSLGRLFAPP